MADDQTTVNIPGTPAPAAGGVLPVHLMPEGLIQDWSTLPVDTAVDVRITKKDLDNLFFSIANSHTATDLTNRAFVQWSNGQVVEAQGNIEASRLSLVAGMNSLRFFFEAVIQAVVKGKQNG